MVRDQHSGHHHDCGPHPLFCSLIPVSLTVRTEGQMDGKTLERAHDSSLHDEEKTDNLSKGMSGCNPPAFSERTCC